MAAGAISKASKGVDSQDAADEEEPFSEPDVVGEGEDDIDVDEEVEPLDDDDEVDAEDAEDEVVDQMELDEKEVIADSKALDTKVDDSDHD